MMYGRTREAKTLEEAIFLTTPAPEMMIMKEMEEISEDGDREGQQRKRALPHTQRRRIRHKIKWPQFS